MKKLEKDSSKSQNLKVEPVASQEIYNTLASPELDNVKRKQYVQFLIDFYLSKTYTKLEPVGYMQGKPNTETYQI